MADISKINGVPIANIEKLDAVLAANIAKVNGLVFSTAAAFLLDTYTGAGAGYSVRRLATSATNLMRIREDAGDTETDIGYDSNNELDTAAIATHCGTANGFVVTWYDQSGNSNNATQSTSGSQPQIYNGTAVITENGKPYLKYGFLTTAVNFGTDNWIFSACGNISNNTKLFFAGSGSSYVGLAQSGSTSSTINSGAGTLTAFRNGSSYSFTTRDALYTDIGTQSLFTINQDNSGWTNVNLGYTGSVDQRMYSLHEVVIYDTDQSTNRTGIESDINNHFAIGNLPNPTSGLLFDYPDAAAAYSVRQLANTAPLSMRVRRDTAGGTGDDDEADVLFDFTLTDPTISLDSRINNASTGVASTTLGEFLNATGYTDVDSLGTVADGFCDTWYDQSGNGNDAEQTAFGNQPQIFDSASPTDLIQENGKPAMSEWYDNEALLIASFGTTHNDVHVFSVTNDAGGTGVIGYVVSGNTGSNFRMARNFSNSDIWLYDGAQAFSTTSEATGQALISSTNETTPTAFFNGSSRSFNNTLNGNGMSGAYIGRHPSLTSGGMRGTIQEIIIFSAHQSSTNRTGIETNINDYFSIY